MNSGYWKSLWVGLTTIALPILIFNEGMNPHELHQFHLNNSPYKDTKHLGKIDRFNQGLSPDRFHEEIYELTMNLVTGEPDYASKQQPVILTDFGQLFFSKQSDNSLLGLNPDDPQSLWQRLRTVCGPVRFGLARFA